MGGSLSSNWILIREEGGGGNDQHRLDVQDSDPPTNSCSSNRREVAAAAAAASTPSLPSVQLNDDCLKEIHSRLPSDSLLRSWRVSKSWLEWTTELLMSRKVPFSVSGLVLVRDPASKDVCDLYVSLPSSQITNNSTAADGNDHLSLLRLSLCEKNYILDICNGILLLCGLEHDNLVVGNPLTHQWLVVPVPDHRHVPLGTVLVFDPSISLHFKIFIFIGRNENIPSSLVILIFSSVTSSWRAVEVAMQDNVVLADAPKVFAFTNDVVFLCSYKLHSSILRADLKEDTVAFRNKELPMSYTTDDHLVKCGENLYQICYDYATIHIWRLKSSDAECTWTLMHRCTCHSLKAAIRERRNISKDHAMVNSNVMIVLTKTKIVSYDFRTNKLACIGRLEEESKYTRILLWSPCPWSILTEEI